EHMVASSATSVTIPMLTATVSARASAPVPIGAQRIAYTDFRLLDVRNGRVADMSVARTEFTARSSPELGTITAEVGRATTADFDIGVLLACLDPAKAKDDHPLQLMRESIVNSYTVRSGNGVVMQIGAVEFDNIAL